jgi:hypothetical protein
MEASFKHEVCYSFTYCLMCILTIHLVTKLTLLFRPIKLNLQRVIGLIGSFYLFFFNNLIIRSFKDDVIISHFYFFNISALQLNIFYIQNVYASLYVQLYTVLPLLYIKMIYTNWGVYVFLSPQVYVFTTFLSLSYLMFYFSSHGKNVNIEYIITLFYCMWASLTMYLFFM